MFGAARWRLALSFTLALGVILVIIGAAVYFTTRTTLLDEVDSDLESRAVREVRELVPRLRRSPRMPTGDLVIGPAFTTGGYFYALVDSSGELLAGTPNADPIGLADTDAIQKALEDGDAFADTESAEGESLRVYVVRLEGTVGSEFLMQVGRSTESEGDALRQLLLVLGGGAAAGLALALAGGYFLSGLALRPIRAAVDSQRAFIAELLRRHPAEPVSANREAVEDIIGESDRLGRLVSQMLTLARADAGQDQLSLSGVAPDELADEVARGMRLLAEERGVEFEVEVDRPLRVRGDRDRLRELLVVLADNAIKYTDTAGKVRLDVRRASAGRVTLQLSDTGPGIPPETLPHIFDRFYHVDQARSRELGGTGLGLAIARWIAEAHGGSIRAESAPAAGTTMTVELPV